MNRFRQHREKILAEKQARQNAASRNAASQNEADQASKNAGANGSLYDTLFAQMAAQKTELSAIESLKTKAERKAEYLPDYEAYIQGILAADEPVQDDVVMTGFIWALDAQNYTLALDIAAWALKHDLDGPPEFSRPVAAILAETLAESALENKDVIELFADSLNDAAELVAEKDMADQARAKLLKALALTKRDSEPEEALSLMSDALSLDPKIGLKREIKSLKSDISKQPDMKPKSGTSGKPASPAPVPASDSLSTSSDGIASASGSGADVPPMD